MRDDDVGVKYMTAHCIQNVDTRVQMQTNLLLSFADSLFREADGTVISILGALDSAAVDLPFKYKHVNHGLYDATNEADVTFLRVVGRVLQWKQQHQTTAPRDLRVLASSVVSTVKQMSARMRAHTRPSGSKRQAARLAWDAMVRMSQLEAKIESSCGPDVVAVLREWIKTGRAAIANASMEDCHDFIVNAQDDTAVVDILNFGETFGGEYTLNQDASEIEADDVTGFTLAKHFSSVLVGAAGVLFKSIQDMFTSHLHNIAKGTPTEQNVADKEDANAFLDTVDVALTLIMTFLPNCSVARDLVARLGVLKSISDVRDDERAVPKQSTQQLLTTWKTVWELQDTHVKECNQRIAVNMEDLFKPLVDFSAKIWDIDLSEIVVTWCCKASEKSGGVDKAFLTALIDIRHCMPSPIDGLASSLEAISRLSETHKDHTSGKSIGILTLTTALEGTDKLVLNCSEASDTIVSKQLSALFTTFPAKQQSIHQSWSEGIAGLRRAVERAVELGKKWNEKHTNLPKAISSWDFSKWPTIQGTAEPAPEDDAMATAVADSKKKLETWRTQVASITTKNLSFASQSDIDTIKQLSDSTIGEADKQLTDAMYHIACLSVAKVLVVSGPKLMTNFGEVSKYCANTLKVPVNTLPPTLREKMPSAKTETDRL